MLGNIISAGSAIAGGLMGQSNVKKQNEATHANLLQQQKMQEEFAKKGIRWRVADAKAAGIHPIYALGATGASYTPTSANFAADTSLPNALASAGQDIGRAINATSSNTERASAFTRAAQALELERGQLGNDNLRLEIASKMARLRQDNAPPMPIGDRHMIPGQAQAPSGALVKDEALERTNPDPKNLHSEPGAVVDRGYMRTSGGLFPAPSKDAKERIEDNWYQETAHFIRNNLLPMISPAFNDPPRAPDKGMAWVYDPVYGYKQVPDKWHRRFLRN